MCVCVYNMQCLYIYSNKKKKVINVNCVLIVNNYTEWSSSGGVYFRLIITFFLF